MSVLIRSTWYIPLLWACDLNTATAVNAVQPREFINFIMQLHKGINKRKGNLGMKKSLHIKVKNLVSQNSFTENIITCMGTFCIFLFHFIKKLIIKTNSAIDYC